MTRAVRQRAATPVLLTLPLAALVALTVQVAGGGHVLEYDRQARDFVAARWPAYTQGTLHSVVDLLANPLYIPFAFIILAAVIARRRSRLAPAVHAGVAIAAVWVLVPAIKLAVGRPGPSLSDPRAEPPFLGAYPSGHTVTSMVVYGMAFYLLRCARGKGRRWVAVAVGAIIGLIEAGLLVLGRYHWTSDVVAGWLLGLVLLLTLTSGQVGSFVDRLSGASVRVAAAARSQPTQAPRAGSLLDAPRLGGRD